MAFPISPINGQTYNGYKWNGELWRVYNEPEAGTIVQVKSITYEDAYSSSIDEYSDIPGLSVSITPKLEGSHFLLTVALGSIGSRDSSYSASFRLMRDAIPVLVGKAEGIRKQGSFQIMRLTSAGNHTTSAAFSGIDIFDAVAGVPLTYKLQMGVQGGTIYYINRAHTDPNNASSYAARAVATITVMEIAQ